MTINTNATITVPVRSIGFSTYWAYSTQALQIWADALTQEEHRGCLSPVWYISITELDDTDTYVGDCINN